MIDHYAQLSIILRGVAAIILLNVLMKQLYLYMLHSPSLQRYRRYLILTVVILIAANCFSFFANLFRQPDGNLVTNVRHISQVFNSVGTLLVAIFFYLIYTYREDDK